MITVAKIYKDSEPIQIKKPTWRESKEFLSDCDARKVNPLTVRAHYKNYIKNRPAHDKLRLGKTTNNRTGALEGFVRAKYLLMVIHKFTCPVCGHVYRDPKTHRVSGKVKFHHVQPLYNPITRVGSGNNDITNIAPVCSEECHRRAHYYLDRGKNIIAIHIENMK